ncbi:hypothetical protein SAMN05216262_101622 [Colwellia chukchiensis]|uniref:Uncharacterized protein n=1 Tax=Colwellia chukchiensis TaxID=641665 RepID=A0A1H7HVZ5_9GAMM|nr:hypothetical protein [Colwellia chukchiensis]SEK54449.1 hypothetical protein SAMN05216262_101622 [Colwellia chukchiensis]
MDDKQTPMADEHDAAWQLNRLARCYLASKSPWYIRRFATPIAALFCSLALLLTVTFIYLIASYSGQAAPCGHNGCEPELSIFQQGIAVDRQSLNISLLEYELQKVIPVEEIQRTRANLTTKFSALKKSLLQGRVVAAKASHQVLTQRLGKTFLPEVAAAMKLIVDSNSLDTAQQIYPADTFYPSLAQAIAQQTVPPLSAKSFANQTSGVEAWHTMLALVKLQYQAEQHYLAQVESYINSMEAYMSFEWLNRLPWIVQLIFWTWFGVLINNIVWLIRLTKQRKEAHDLAYSAPVYLMLFPRLAIAPFISVIFLAMISSGIASFDISNLNNLPAFLVAAFFLGFMSESITLRIRQFFNKLLDSIKAKKQRKLTMAALTPAASYTPLANTSISHLETNMHALVNTELTVSNIRNQVIKKARLDSAQ